MPPDINPHACILTCTSTSTYVYTHIQNMHVYTLAHTPPYTHNRMGEKFKVLLGYMASWSQLSLHENLSQKKISRHNGTHL